jgi:Raf kinase inhibitor-like YbhB/YbcL family protein
VITNRYRLLAGAAAATLALGITATSAGAADIFTLKSSTFSEGQIMPKKVSQSTANVPTNKNCVGENVSPQLSWTNVPNGTKSFIIINVDLEGRGGAGVDQWVAYGIPASLTGLAEGEGSKPSANFVGGKNIGGGLVYSGPCTPPNTTPHHYNFILLATDFDPKDLPPGLTSREVQDKLAPPPGQPPAHTKGASALTGLFVNPYPQ